MTSGLYLPNILISVFFVAGKACKNLAIVISDCYSMGKKLILSNF